MVCCKKDVPAKERKRGAYGNGHETRHCRFGSDCTGVRAVAHHEPAGVRLRLRCSRGASVESPIPSNGRGDGISAAQRTANIKAFCGTIQNAGYKAGVYANKTWFTSKINTSQLTNYKIWLAQYAASPTYNATRYDMWQYTSKGKVSGILGNVDMNTWYRWKVGYCPAHQLRRA